MTAPRPDDEWPEFTPAPFVADEDDEWWLSLHPPLRPHGMTPPPPPIEQPPGDDYTVADPDEEC